MARGWRTRDTLRLALCCALSATLLCAAGATFVARPAEFVVTPLPKGARRLCVFDFGALDGGVCGRAASSLHLTLARSPDDTIKMSDDSVATGARWVIDACVSAGYGISIATASCFESYIHNYLRTRVEPQQWTHDILRSSAYQGCQLVKSWSLPRILDSAGLREAPGCAVLFDQGYNRHYAEEVGMAFEEVDGTYGLQRADWHGAQAELEQLCPLQRGNLVT